VKDRKLRAGDIGEIDLLQGRSMRKKGRAKKNAKKQRRRLTSKGRAKIANLYRGSRAPRDEANLNAKK